MEKDNSITQYFGANLAELLADKILEVYKDFNKNDYLASIRENCNALGYTQRIELHAVNLHAYLPKDFIEASNILISILGEENKNETGMFKAFYWIMPIGKYIEKYGLGAFEQSMYAIEEVTKRNTGEYAIRPFIRMYPDRKSTRLNSSH